jgi:hypothetical protein
MITYRPILAILTASALIAAGAIAAGDPSPAATKPATTSTAPDHPVASPADLMPKSKFVAAGPTTVAVVAADVKAVTNGEGRYGPPDALGLSWDGASYRWVWVQVKDKPLVPKQDIPVGPDGKKTKQYQDLAMATPAIAKQWGVQAPFTLVEVEVNSGLGSPAVDSLVATNVKVVEGTGDYPLKAGEVVAAARQAYDKFLRDGREKTFAPAMEGARKDALGEDKPTGPQEESTLMHVTWLAVPKRLRVAFLTTITNGRYEYVTGGAAVGGPVGNIPATPGIRIGTSYGIQFGRAYEFSINGELAATETLTLSAFSRILPRPQ